MFTVVLKNDRGKIIKTKRNKNGQVFLTSTGVGNYAKHQRSVLVFLTLKLLIHKKKPLREQFELTALKH